MDGLGRAAVERQGVAAVLQEIAEDLQGGRDKPPPVRRGYLPTPDGRPRPLGVPTVRERVVQQACTRVIAPLFAAHFHDHADGFRPKRRAAQAVNRVKAPLVGGWSVVDAAIDAYGDPIAHTGLMRLVKRRISDRRVLTRLRPWLQVGVMEEGRWQATARGCPQGGVVSPLLANRYVHVRDRYWTERDAALGSLTRSADDGVIGCRTRAAAPRALEAVAQVLQKLTLTRHPTQTRLVELPHEGCELLGCHFKPVKARTSGRVGPLLWPSQKARKAGRRQQVRGLPSRRGSSLHWAPVHRLQRMPSKTADPRPVGVHLAEKLWVGGDRHGSLPLVAS